jgi:hypothetical protein
MTIFGLTGKVGAPGSQFHVLPGTLYRLMKSSLVGGRVLFKQKPTSSSDYVKYLGLRRGSFKSCPRLLL